MEINSIGLEAKASKQLSEDLNVLLANFQRYYQNLRGIHWNIKGKGFFDLHQIKTIRRIGLGIVTVNRHKPHSPLLITLCQSRKCRGNMNNIRTVITDK